MAKQGRQSAAELSMVSNVTEIDRLRAPTYLDDKLKSIWVQIVNSKPATFFGHEHISMLEALCRHIVQAQVISDMIDKLMIDFEVNDESIRQLEKLHKMHRIQTQAQENLMRAMRLTHQAIYRANKAPNPNGGEKSKPWLK